MSVKSLQRSTSNIHTVNSLAARERGYGRGACPDLSTLIVPKPEKVTSLPEIGGRHKYSSQSYWSAIDIDNPQKKTQIAIKNYRIKHQGLNTLNIVIEYSYHYGLAIANAFNTDLIYRQLNLLLINYPNEEDFWEVMNCYLTEGILKLNPQLSEVTITIAVHPNGEFPYHRSTTVNQTNCGSRQETWHFNFPLSFVSPIAKNLSTLYKVNVDYIYDINSWEFPYPDFMIIYRQLEDLLASNWEPKSWLKTRHKLINFLLEENLTLASVSLDLERI